MKIDPGRISLRPSTDGDRRFSYEVKKAALRVYIEPVWGWDESFQVEFHRKDWAKCRPDIVRLDDRDIGTMEVRRGSEGLHLGEFYLFPDFQRQGIGSYLMSRLVVEADTKGVPIRLEVIKINPVQSLYRRFGFTAIGETNTHFIMERRSGRPTRAGGAVN